MSYLNICQKSTLVLKVPIISYTNNILGDSFIDWDKDKKQFRDYGRKEWYLNNGKTSNDYYRKYSKVIRHNTLEAIHNALFDTDGKSNPNIIADYGTNFKSRNTCIAKDCDYLLAFTFGEGEVSKDEGTLDVWNKCNLKKGVSTIHIHLRSLTTKNSNNK